MAEFQKVMRQAKRMCDAQAHCGGCPAIKTCFTGLNNMEVDDDRCCEFECVIMKWAEEHPEPRYPTWEEWWRKEFPNADRGIYPCMFGIRERFGCYEQSCNDCRNKPIPADIAEKMGIKPK